jgi:CDP-6-deoxy-D-xylo-4-hexulose-3-dehydrase
MFEEMDEKQARAYILESVRAYTLQYHNQSRPFTPGNRIPYASRVYGPEEVCALVDSSLDFWLTSGRYTQEFEKRFAETLGVRFCALVNSGSSANLLAFMTLTSPLLGERAIHRGDEVITVACGFPTTVTPIIQFGAVPVFVDVTLPTYNVNVAMLEKAVSPKTKAVMIAHTLGNPFNLKAVKDFCDSYGLWLVEDNCDALGSQYVMDGKTMYTGTIGDIGTSSFYPAHHITMGEGGATYTNNPLLGKIMRSIRDWGRDCVCASGQDNRCGHRFSGQYGELPFGYDHKYVYSHFGYNLKATDMQAAIGCEQLKRLTGFSEKRRENFAFLRNQLTDVEDQLILPQATDNSIPSWFGFIITCRAGLSKQRIVESLEDNGIQTRNLFAGNLLRHPCFDEMRSKGNGYRVIGSLTVTDQIMRDSFWIGVYPGMQPEQLQYMTDTIHQLVR